MSLKSRPNVDPRVFQLADVLMDAFDVISDHADREDLTWELAGELQESTEAFFEVSCAHRVMRMKMRLQS